MKIAIITGASSGIGREFERQIANRYSRFDEIWLIARTKEPMEEIAAAMKPAARIISMDLTNPEDLREFSGLLSSENPEIKLLVNCAGYGKIGNIKELSSKEQLGMIDLNCRSLTDMTIMCLPYISSHSRIINVASAAAYMPQPKFAVYAATKSYVLSFSRALRAELKSDKISVTAVCPGPVDTNFFNIAGSDVKFFKKLLMAKPEKVVEKAIKDAAMGNEISIYGFIMNLACRFSWLVPKRLFMKLFK